LSPRKLKYFCFCIVVKIGDKMIPRIDQEPYFNSAVAFPLIDDKPKCVDLGERTTEDGSLKYRQRYFGVGNKGFDRIPPYAIIHEVTYADGLQRVLIYQGQVRQRDSSDDLTFQQIGNIEASQGRIDIKTMLGITD